MAGTPQSETILHGRSQVAIVANLELVHQTDTLLPDTSMTTLTPLTRDHCYRASLSTIAEILPCILDDESHLTTKVWNVPSLDAYRTPRHECWRVLLAIKLKVEKKEP